MFPRISRLGEETWLVEFEPRLDHDINKRVLAIADTLERSRPPGVSDIVPACASLAVHVDPDRLDEAELRSTLEGLLSTEPRDGPHHRTIDIPVCYDSEFAFDIDAVSKASGCSVPDVVARHSGATYRVFMLGFLPGFPYMGIVDESIAVPRLATPRRAVPAGSVGIAGRQTGIYPIDSPGGWQILGRTPARLYDPISGRPPMIRGGDSVRFVPIDARRFSELAGTLENRQ
jgi:KipI family sensor histidine kinase inhibitor